MAARFAEVTDTRRRARSAPPVRTVDLECAGGGPTLPVSLLDLSTYGARLGGDGAEGVGDHVRLSLAGRPPIAATVVWRQQGSVGCRFDKPIATTLMKALICGEG